MATTKGKTILTVCDGSTSVPPVPPVPPDPPDLPNSPSLSLTTIGKTKDTNFSLNSPKNLKGLKVLHVSDIALECNYDSIVTSLGPYGQIKEIRMNLNENGEKWEAWLTYDNQDDAFNACRKIDEVLICNSHIQGALTDKVPRNLDYYKPADWISANPARIDTLERTPKPPMWLVVNAKEEKFNYYRLSKHLQKMVGGIKSGDISRFGRGKVLIHTKSNTQSLMLCHMNLQNDPMIRSIRPHNSFSYGRGVIFDRDLHEFEEKEILDMSPPSVCKVKKIPRTSMIVLTFEDSNVPSHVVYENERIRVRPFHPKPLQCFNCFQYGHPSNICRNAKICNNCSSQEHGTCEAVPKCTNCHLDHKSTDRICEEYKKEEAALAKANAEHTTVGYARRLLGQSPSYARVARNPSINTTGVKAAAPITGGGAVVPVVRSLSSERPATPARVGETSIPLGIATPPSPPPHLAISQADSLPDLMIQEQVSVPKRVRTPSYSPPHVRQKCNSPHRKEKDSYEIQESEVEVHHPPVKEEKLKLKNKPQITRKANKSNK